jgi:ArsR family transcriptional regulator
MDIRIFELTNIQAMIMSDLFSPPTLFKCLADATRARLTLLILREGELCVCELIHALDDSQPKISRHLAQLRSCGLLLDRRQGQWIYYRINPALPGWVTQVLDTTLQANQPWLQNDAQRLDAMGDRPQRVTTCC